jgi:hypothetical protein
MSAANAILAVAVEGLTVGIFTLIAGANDEAGSAVILFMIGLWLIWLVSNSDAVSRIAGTVGNINNIVA